jgi:hypothetical protein
MIDPSYITMGKFRRQTGKFSTAKTGARDRSGLSNTANAKLHPQPGRSDLGLINIGNETIQNELPTYDEKAGE